MGFFNAPTDSAGFLSPPLPQILEDPHGLFEVTGQIMIPSGPAGSRRFLKDSLGSLGHPKDFGIFRIFFWYSPRVLRVTRIPTWPSRFVQRIQVFVKCFSPPQDSFIFSGPHGILPDAWGFSGLLKILQVLLYALGFLGAFQASSGPPGYFSIYFKTLLGFWRFPGGSSGSLSAPRSSQDSSGPVGAHQDSSERLRVVQDSAGFSGALWSESLARMRARASAGEEVRARAPNKSDVSNACDYMTAQRGPEHKSIGLRIVPPPHFSPLSRIKQSNSLGAPIDPQFAPESGRYRPPSAPLRSRIYCVFARGAENYVFSCLTHWGVSAFLAS